MRSARAWRRCRPTARPRSRSAKRPSARPSRTRRAFRLELVDAADCRGLRVGGAQVSRCTDFPDQDGRCHRARHRDAERDRARTGEGKLRNRAIGKSSGLEFPANLDRRRGTCASPSSSAAPTGERLVSVASAQALHQALPEADLWWWDVEDKVHVVQSKQVLEHARPFEDEFNPARAAFRGQALDQAKAEGRVLVLGLHGGRAENGDLQVMCEARGVPFTVSGSASSHLAFDKVAASILPRSAA